MSDEIIRAADWPAVAANLPAASMLLAPLIPAHGKTLLHGPPGSGKSAVMWGIGNAVASGAPTYLGLPIKQAGVLLISTDMSIYEIKHRWDGVFLPLFDLVCVPGFDCTRPEFTASKLYTEVQQHVATYKIQLVMIDALGRIHAGRSARDDEVADQVDDVLTKWFPDASLLLISHDRKTQYGEGGVPLPPSPEDFLGSQKWRANVTSQMHLWPVGEYHSRLQHDKSQVSQRLEDLVNIYIDLRGQAELFDEHRVKEVVARFQEAIIRLGLEGVPPSRQDEAIAKHYGKTVRTIKRWRAMAKKA